MCPHCGRPVAAVTIERTAKRFKLMQAAGVLLFFIAGIWLMSGLSAISGKPESDVHPLAVALLLISIGALLVARIGAWWHHE